MDYVIICHGSLWRYKCMSISFINVCKNTQVKTWKWREMLGGMKHSVIHFVWFHNIRYLQPLDCRLNMSFHFSSLYIVCNQYDNYQNISKVCVQVQYVILKVNLCHIINLHTISSRFWSASNALLSMTSKSSPFVSFSKFWFSFLSYT